MISERQKKLLESIVLWQSGPDEGLPTNERLRELHGMLSKYSYPDRELDMLEIEVLGATPPRALKRLTREREGVK